MTTASTAVATHAMAPPPSPREREKLAAHRLPRRVAFDLAAERGLANVTVQDIAAAAEVSPRTFLNSAATRRPWCAGSRPCAPARTCARRTPRGWR